MKLNLVHPRVSPGDLPAIQVKFRMQGNRLVAEFDVINSPIRANTEFPKNEPSWGLWDWDVVELFVSVQDAHSEVPMLPYFEFQVSPLGQYFELRVDEPRKRFDREFRCRGLEWSAKQHDGRSWSAHISIPLGELGWIDERTPLLGNAYAILGEAEARTYWSLHGPVQDIPDFHRPEYFKALLLSH